MEQNKKIGTLLKDYRENQQLSIEDISETTKININILKSLESNNLDTLPNKTYIKGFVTNYAKAVNLDIEKARDSLEHTYQEMAHPRSSSLQKEGAKENKEKANKKEPDPESTELKSAMREAIISIIQGCFNKKVLYSFVVLLILFAIGKGVVNFFSQLHLESKAITTKMSNINTLKSENTNIFKMNAAQKHALSVLKSQEKKKEKELTPPPTQKRTQQEKVLTKENIVSKDLPLKKIKEKPLDGKFPFKKFYTAPKNMYKIVKGSSEARDSTILPLNIRASLIKGKQNVYIVAKDQDTWISYQTDSKKIKRYILRKGRRVLIKGERILLLVGNFNAVKIFLNNELISAQTKTGVKSMIFPEILSPEYELPLFPSFNGIPYSANFYKNNMQEKRSAE